MSSSPIKEFELITSLASLLEAPDESIIGIGDDCAVVEVEGTDKKFLYSVDTLVDTVHFDLGISSAFDVGYKSVAVNASDIAAMGGIAKFILVSLQIPETKVGISSELYRGIESCCRDNKLFVIGGDTTASDRLAISVTIIGELVGEPLLRSGVRPGDNIYLSGVAGEAWAGLSLAQAKISKELISDPEACLVRHRRPTPQLPLGNILQQRKLATAAIDISDGVVAEAKHLARASGVTIELWLDAIPLPFAREVSLEKKIMAITGGDDYQILFASTNDLNSLQKDTGSMLITPIGIALARAEQEVFLYSQAGGEGINLHDYDAGYQHFK